MGLLSAIEPVRAVLGRSHTLLEGPRIAGEGALVYSDAIAGGLFACEPSGEIVELPAAFVSSISFGGQDMRDVLITTADNREQPQLGGTLLRARSEVAGQPLAPVSV